MRFPAFRGLTVPVARELVKLATERGFDPVAIAAVIENESGWDPKAGTTTPPWSTGRTASGLIQWTEGTLRQQTGYTPSQGEYLTRDWLSKLSALEQLPLVMQYYQNSLQMSGPRPVDYYLAGWGNGIGKPDDHVLASYGDMRPYFGSTKFTYNDIYAQNKGLDLDQTGQITVGDLRRIMERRIAAAQARGSLDLDSGSPAVLPPWDDWQPSAAVAPPAMNAGFFDSAAAPVVGLALFAAWKFWK